MSILVDLSYVRDRITGIERIALELFSPEALAPLQVRLLKAKNVAQMLLLQHAGIALELVRDNAAVLVCPGFPPAPELFPFRSRIIPYIHDTFLLTRWSDLSPRAKLYMSAPFWLCVKSYRQFFVNSECTRDDLKRFCHRDATIVLYRPEVRNIFGLAARSRYERKSDGKLRLVTLGTVEPRKNLKAAARITSELNRIGIEAELDVVGRKGWGDDWAALERSPHVRLRGYCSNEEIKALLEQADILINTSHAEGLGLPLLEAQYAGILVAAPERRVFREVLGSSGLFIEPDDEASAAKAIASATESPKWRECVAEHASLNLSRWNMAARHDRAAAAGLLMTMEKQCK